MLCSTFNMLFTGMLCYFALYACASTMIRRERKVTDNIIPMLIS